jgi:hypothetical protein
MLADDRQDMFKIDRTAPYMPQVAPSPGAECNYDLPSDALVWSDEKPAGLPFELIGDLRCLLNFRTSLILGKPREEFRGLWNAAQEAFPLWRDSLPNGEHRTSVGNSIGYADSHAGASPNWRSGITSGGLGKIGDDPCERLIRKGRLKRHSISMVTLKNTSESRYFVRKHSASSQQLAGGVGPSPSVCSIRGCVPPPG